MRIDLRQEQGPFDIIGDAHGCADELERLLAALGYSVRVEEESGARRAVVAQSGARRAVFVGDLVDRGPRSPDVLRIAMAMVEAGQAFCVIGNHDAKFLRWLKGSNVQLKHGLSETVAQMRSEPEDFRRQVRDFLEALPSHVWLDGGRLAVAHAGIKEYMLGSALGSVRAFCLYGETTGESDELGLPIRLNWAADYRGSTTIVYGHTPVDQAVWLNNTICIDTGCCFGGRLTALRWPQREIVSVRAARVYMQPARPLAGTPQVPGA
ncbi:MAG: metallophosphoesterase [Bacteroidota bacterium]